MLKRNDYITIIEEIRNTDKKSIDEYINKELDSLQLENKNLFETLYKDIYYILKDIDKPGENDLVIENGDFVVQDGDLKLTGYQSRLHILSIWLHMRVCKKFMEVNPTNFVNEMKNFEDNFLNKPNYTPEFKYKLDDIKKSLERERRMNLGEQTNFWSKVFDFNNLELKPNIAGIGINLNEIINKFKQH